MFDLFDTLVKPIVLINSKIWGININKELEQFHLSFMKIMLGVKKSTNNCLIYAETWRYPLYIYICIYIRIVKYWLKISTASEHRYIYIIYNKCPSS